MIVESDNTTLRRALARTEAAFLAEDGPEPLLARREAGQPAAEDETRATTFVAQLRERLRPTGQTRLVETAADLLLLDELDGPSARDAAAPAIAALRARQGAPGRYADGCTPQRHQLGLCHHTIGGFLAPDNDEAIPLRSGAIVPAGTAARLVASCLGLRALLRWGVLSNDVRLHLAGLRHLVSIDPREVGAFLPLEALPAILAALLAAPADAANTTAVNTVLERILQRQRADGSWPEMDTFYLLEVLLDAARSGIGNKRLDAAIHRGAGLLALSQQPDGHWEREHNLFRTRIGWRALRYGLDDGTAA